MTLNSEQRRILAGVLMRLAGHDGHGDPSLLARRVRTHGDARQRALAAVALDVLGAEPGSNWVADGARVAEVIEAGPHVMKLIGSLLESLADGDTAFDAWINSARCAR